MAHAACKANWFKHPTSGMCKPCLPPSSSVGDATTQTCSCASPGAGYLAGGTYNLTTGCR